MVLAKNQLEQIVERLANNAAQEFLENLEGRSWAEFLSPDFLADLQQSLKQELVASVHARLQWSYQAARVEAKNQLHIRKTQLPAAAPVQPFSSSHAEVQRPTISSSRSSGQVLRDVGSSQQAALLQSTLQEVDKPPSSTASGEIERTIPSGARRRSGAAGPPTAYGYKPIKRQSVSRQQSKAS